MEASNFYGQRSYFDAGTIYLIYLDDKLHLNKCHQTKASLAGSRPAWWPRRKGFDRKLVDSEHVLLRLPKVSMHPNLPIQRHLVAFSVLGLQARSRKRLESRLPTRITIHLHPESEMKRLILRKSYPEEQDYHFLRQCQATIHRWFTLCDHFFDKFITKYDCPNRPHCGMIVQVLPEAQPRNESKQI